LGVILGRGSVVRGVVNLSLYVLMGALAAIIELPQYYTKTTLRQIDRNGSIASHHPAGYSSRMAYTSNPHLPKIRREAARLVVEEGWSARKVSRYLGYHHTTIMCWVRYARQYGIRPIPTQSSKPRRHPRQLSDELVRKIVAKRFELRRCAEVVHFALKEEGVRVSLCSVKRTLDRRGLLKKRSPWKRRHVSVSRPSVEKPGDLVQLDTVHLMRSDGTRVYVFTGLDVHTRFAHAWAFEKANTRTALCFLRRMKKVAPFAMRMLQSDNGSEFSTSFSERARIEHRHSRVRRPNDNAHLERFNRTIQEGCLDALPRDTKVINKNLPKWLRYYNEKRHHFGLNLKTPLQVVRSY
jgi:transposase InsO family protein